MAQRAGYVGAFYIAKNDCLTFADSGDFVTVTNPTTSDLDFGQGDDFTVEAWLRSADMSTNKYYGLNKGGQRDSDASSDITKLGYKLGWNGGKATFALGDTAGDSITVSDTTSTDTGVWRHLVGVRDAEAKVYLYVDGEFTASDTDTTSDLVVGSDLIMGDKSTTVATAVGMARIYNRIVTAAQVSDLYGGDFPGALKGALLGEWMYYEGGDNNINDSSGKGNDGTNTGGTWATTTYDTVTDEIAGAGDGSTKIFTLANENVDNKNLTVTLSDIGSSNTQQIGQDFTITPKGKITFTTAPPTSDNVKVSYRHYKMVLEAGGFTSWSFDAACDTLETTDFRSTGWREYKAGLKGWTGTAERHWINPLTKNALGNKYIVKFFTDEANEKYYTGWAIISGFSPTTPVDTLVDESLGFQGTYRLGNETL